MNLSNEVGIARLMRSEVVKSQERKELATPLGDGWPILRDAYELFKPNYGLHHYDRLWHEEYYVRLMRREFEGLSPVVKDHVQRTESLYHRKDGKLEELKVEYFYVKIELDEYRRQPDPVLTRWQCFKLWLLRQPKPRSPVPPRTVKHYRLSKMQANLLRKLFRELKHES